jgi:hypothetical protein
VVDFLCGVGRAAAVIRVLCVECVLECIFVFVFWRTFVIQLWDDVREVWFAVRGVRGLGRLEPLLRRGEDASPFFVVIAFLTLFCHGRFLTVACVGLILEGM